ncbi:MAG: hypothetical protein R3290_03710 [Acidimicrobiia bacterium]|nr:hypothetical protein [Acidimicrobiia bacterium]
MRRTVLAVTATLVAAALGWTVRLALDPEPFAGDSAAVLAVGGGVLALVAVTGIVMARGRWARWTAASLVALWLGLAAAMPLDAGGGAVLALTAMAGTAVAGPWLDRWLRRLPSADGPEPLVVATVVGIAALPLVVALTRPGGLSPAAWTLVAVATVTAWTLARALRLGLWSARVALPLAGGWAAVDGGVPGGIVIGAVAVVLTLAAWRRAVRLAVDPLLPPPVERVPHPPELVPPDILEAAGYDDRGAPLEER